MRHFPCHPYQEEDRGILGHRSSSSTLPPTPAKASLSRVEKQRQQVQRLQQSLQIAKANRTLSQAQIEEAERHLETLQEQYEKDTR